MIDLQWRALEDQAAQARLGAVLESWRGTPYMSGQRCKGVGVDCVRFVIAVFDEMNGTDTPVKTVPGDVAQHAPEVARAALELLLRSFDCSRVREPYLEPGDVIVTGPNAGGPGHAMIVGAERRMCWHAAPATGVCSTSLGIIGMLDQKVFAAYRMTSRKWGASWS